MLNVIEYGKDEYDFPALLVLGCFDAIHVGHRELLKKAKLQAKINGLDLGVMLFRDGKGDKLVCSFEERLAILQEFAVKFVLVIDYNSEFKATAPLDFLREVEKKVNVKAYMSGKDFRFGANAKGKSATLKSYAEDEDNGVWYMPVKDVTVNDEKVSTTSIKVCLANGDVAGANALLGSTYCVSGEVIQGAGRGADTLGFPTVNINYPEEKYPIKQGVYTVKCNVGETRYFGIANYGTCPTFGDERVALEVHLNGFDGNLYGETLKIEFLGYLRDIVAFASPDELAAQLITDKAASEALAKQIEEEEAAKPVADESVKEEAPKQEAAPVAEAVENAEEAVAETQTEAPAQPAVEEIAISAQDYSELANGFDDVADEVPEEVSEEPAAETAEVAAEEIEQVEEPAAEPETEAAEEEPSETEPAEETVAPEQAPEEKQPAETEEQFEAEEPEQSETEEPAEEAQSEEAPAEAVADEEQPAEQPVEVKIEEEYEIIEGGFDEIVEEPVDTEEEAPTEEQPEEVTEERKDEAPEEATEEVSEEKAEESVEEITEEDRGEGEID